MAKRVNVGKEFEEAIKKSTPEGAFYYRFRDSASGWNGGNGARFTTTNIADCLVFMNGDLCVLELKTTKGKSLPIGNIRDNQLKGMLEADAHNRVYSYFLINFREEARTFAVSINYIAKFIQESLRKSIPIDWCEEVGIELEGCKKRVKYTWNLNKLFNILVK